MGNKLLTAKLILFSAWLALSLACGGASQEERSGNTGVAPNVGKAENTNSAVAISSTPEMAESNLPKYTAGKLAEFLSAEYQKPGGKKDPNAGLKDKEIEVTGSVALVKSGEVAFFVDQATLVRCLGSFYTDKDFPALESYYQDNVRGTTKYMPNARAKATFSYWGATANGKGTEIVLSGCQILGASRL